MTDATAIIDASLKTVLAAAGTKLANYMPGTQEKLREAMRNVMGDSYIKGSNDCHAALVSSGKIRK